MLDYEIFGRPLGTYAWVAALVMGGVTVSAAGALVWYVALAAVRGRREGGLAAIVLRRTRKAGGILIAALVLRFVFQEVCQTLWSVTVTERAGYVWGSGLIEALLIGLGCWLAYAVLAAVIEWYSRDYSNRLGEASVLQFRPVVERVLRVVIFVIGLIMALKAFKVEISPILATAGVVSLAVALAAQETIANAIAGFCIMADRAFRPGDRIELPGGEWADVHDMGLRSTKFLTLDKNLLIVPNAELAKSRIVNHSYPTRLYRVRQTVGVAYGSDVGKVKEILQDVARNTPQVVSEPVPEAYFMEFAECSLNVLFMYSLEDYRDRYAAIDNVNMAIQRRFREEGIEIPFPQQDVHIRSRTEEGVVNSE